MPTDTAERESTPQISTGRLLAVLVVAVLGFAFQQTSIVPAVRTVQQALGSSQEWSTWLVTVYLIVATVATPAMGRLGDLHGRRRMLVIGLGVFLAGSIAAACAPSMPFLIVCRAVQGVGGAVYPLCLALAREVLPKERVTTAVAVLTGAFGAGTAVGFVGGGALSQYASWRWIFVVGAVLVAAGVVLAARGLPELAGRAGGGFDLPGTAILAVAVMTLLIALTLAVPLGWVSPVTILLLVVAALSGLAWTRYEVRRDDPLIDVHVVTKKAVAVANLSTVGLGWALFGSYLLVPQLIQTSPTSGFGLGGHAAEAGLLMLPLAIGQTVAAPLAGRISPRVGARWLTTAGLVLGAAALVLLSFVHRAVVPLALLTLLLGVGAGLALEASSDVATQGVADDVAAVSSALNSTVRRLAGGVGGQVSTVLLASFMIAGSSNPDHNAFAVAFVVAAAMAMSGAAVMAGFGPKESP